MFRLFDTLVIESHHTRLPRYAQHALLSPHLVQQIVCLFFISIYQLSGARSDSQRRPNIGGQDFGLFLKITSRQAQIVA